MRTVVVASGKGGTGKTTLTALFAHTASAEGAVVTADCDVEASNLPLALGVAGVESEPFGGGAIATIDPRACIGCGMCATVCRYGAILEPDLEPESGLPTIAYSIDPLACEGCGACIQVSCPNIAIELRDKDVGELRWGTAATGPIAFGRLSPGEDLSGKLVTEVRRKAEELAATEGADLVIVDGPPGVGCSVIAALANTEVLVAVTEPTVAGEHDLARLVELAKGFDLPVAVVLNKADLSKEGAERIRSFCETKELPLIAEIPFDERLAGALEGLAEGSGFEDLIASGSASVEAVLFAWRVLTGSDC